MLKFQKSLLATALCAVVLTGCSGDDGAQGPAGPAGAQGEAGVQGAQGETGTQGAQGETGAQGEQGEAGAQGEQGETGAQGEQGQAGLNSLVVQTTLATDDQNCALGGVQIDSGVDDNGNGTLEAGEVDSTSFVCQTQSKAMDLTILHMNDHHSHIEADDFDFSVSELGLTTTNEAGEAIAEVEVKFGGFPMLKSLFDDLEAQHENVIKLHAGDAITGTLYYSLFNGEADAAVMNEICFDAFALGNHEFDDGDAGLARFLNFLRAGTCDTPVLAANVAPGEGSAIEQGYIQPYTIIKRSGQQIGVVGIDIAGKTKNSSSPDETTQFLDEIKTAQSTINTLTEMGVDKIILLTHYGLSNDIALASAVSGVDVIIGGDSHTLLGNQETFARFGFNPIGPYPAQRMVDGNTVPVTDADGNMVCVAQAWEYAKLMGKLEVSFDDNGVVTSCGGHPYMPVTTEYTYEFNDNENRTLTGGDAVLVTNALTSMSEVAVTTPDPVVTSLISGFEAQVEVLEQTVIGTVAEDLCLERFPGQGRSTICDRSVTYNRGSDISNIVAKAFMTVTPTADIGLQNGGGVRVDVATGDFTIASAFTLLPFSNTLVTFDMTGEQIVAVLEEALANTIDNQGSSGSYPYASGLRFDVDASAAFGSRISNVEVNSRIAGDWTAIDMTATYKVVTNDFIGGGRDGYTTLGTLTSENTFTEYAQGFIDYVQQLTAAGESVSKLPEAEYSTKSYINRAGCNHATDATCEGY